MINEYNHNKKIEKILFDAGMYINICSIFMAQTLCMCTLNKMFVLK